MKRICFLFVLVGALLVQATAMQAQEQRRPRMSRGEAANRDKQANENSGLPELTVRAQNMNEQLTQDIGNARWMRVIYRQLDMLKESNAPLYYPTSPMNGMMNLFSTIFQLAGEDKLPIYEYIDGYEIFDEAHRKNFKDYVLDRFEILYETVRGVNSTEGYVINESDVPSEEVKSFYIKEAWYFDQNNSIYDVKILALCPLMTRNMDVGEQTTPMFWVPYEALRPYVSNSYVMTSNLNNAKTFTVDDYFRRRMFEGDIIKTENLLNLPLMAYMPPDSMQIEQQRIEGELNAFRDSLWFKPDTTQLTTADKKALKKSRKASATKEKKTSAKKEKAPKSSGAAKPEKSAPTRSVRRGK